MDIGFDEAHEDLCFQCRQHSTVTVSPSHIDGCFFQAHLLSVCPGLEVALALCVQPATTAHITPPQKQTSKQTHIPLEKG